MASEQVPGPETQAASTAFRALATSNNNNTINDNDNDTAKDLTAPFALIITPSSRLDVTSCLPRISPTSNPSIQPPGSDSSPALGESARGGLRVSVAFATPVSPSASVSASCLPCTSMTSNNSAPQQQFGAHRMQEASSISTSNTSSHAAFSSSTLSASSSSYTATSPVTALNSALSANSIHSATSPIHSAVFSANAIHSANALAASTLAHQKLMDAMPVSTVAMGSAGITTSTSMPSVTINTAAPGNNGARTGVGGGSGGGKKTATIPKFLRFLFEMLEKEDNEIIAWAHKGTAFQIRQPEALASRILPKYFKHNKVSSFQRQLNYFGFKKWTKTQTTICTFSHPYFIRGDKEKMKLIRRKERSPHAKKDKTDTQPIQPNQQSYAKKAVKHSANSQETQQRKSSSSSATTPVAANKKKGKTPAVQATDHSLMQLDPKNHPIHPRSRKRTAASMSMSSSSSQINAQQSPALSAFQHLQHSVHDDDHPQQPDKANDDAHTPTRKRSSSGARMLLHNEEPQHQQRQHRGLPVSPIQTPQRVAGEFARNFVSDLDLHLPNASGKHHSGVLLGTNTYGVEPVPFSSHGDGDRDHPDQNAHSLGGDASVDQNDESFCNLPTFGDRGVDHHALHGNAFPHFLPSPHASGVSSCSSSTSVATTASCSSTASFTNPVKSNNSRDHHHSGLLDHSSLFGSASMGGTGSVTYSASSWGYTQSHPSSSSSSTDPTTFHDSHVSLLSQPSTGGLHHPQHAPEGVASSGNSGSSNTDHGVPHEDYIDALLESTGFDSLSGHVNDPSHLTGGPGSDHWRSDHVANTSVGHSSAQELHAGLFQHHHPFPAPGTTAVLGRHNGNNNSNNGSSNHDHQGFSAHGYGSAAFDHLQSGPSASASAPSSSSMQQSAMSQVRSSGEMVSSSSTSVTSATPSSTGGANGPPVNYNCELTSSFNMDPRKAPSF